MFKTACNFSRSFSRIFNITTTSNQHIEQAVSSSSEAHRASNQRQENAQKHTHTQKN
jgi:hypothetical protein